MSAADIQQLGIQGVSISQWTYHQGKQVVSASIFNFSPKEVASISADVLLLDAQNNLVGTKPVVFDSFEDPYTGYKGSLLPKRYGTCTVTVDMPPPVRYGLNLKSATYYAKGDEPSDMGHLFAMATRGDNDGLLKAIDKDPKLLMVKTPDTGLMLIHIAAASNNLALTKALIDKGVDYATPAANGSTPLFCAINSGSSDVASYLIDRGADINVKKGGMTPMEMAAMNCSGQVIEKMIQKGADPNEKKGRRANPIEMAARSGNIDAAKVLLEHGADPNFQDRWHTPALFHAVDGDQPKMIAFLADHGAMIDGVNSNGYTPLMIAAGRGFPDVVQSLLQKGANTGLTGPDGKTALQLAEEYGNTRAADVLKNAGTKKKA